MDGRLPLTDLRRQEARDNKLWEREVRRAKQFGVRSMCCPCTVCGGTEPPIKIAHAKKHLREQQRAPDCRVFRGPEPNDSSDDEWERAWHKSFEILEPPHIEKPDLGINVRGAVGDLFRNFDDIESMEADAHDITRIALEETDRIFQPEEYNEEDPHIEDQRKTGNSNTNCNAPSFTDNTSIHVAEDHFNTKDYVQEHVTSIHHDDNESDLVQAAKRLQDALKLLYTGSRVTQLGACIMILNLKATHSGMSDRLADDVICTLKKLLPSDNCLPSSLYQMKTITTNLGISFENIDSCLNGCILFDQPDTKGKDKCPTCNHNRYKDMVKKCKPYKVLRHFHLIPRLKRFYRVPALSKLMRWHAEHRSTDGLVRYPADSQAWKRLDSIPPAEFDTKMFGENFRDVRLKVSVDGVNPFKLNKSTWSAWPVLVSFLNLPPWLITKKFFTMLSLIIPGRKQVPFKYFNVWMRPLMDELRTLWEGVPGYDILEPIGHRTFNLRAAVLYTIHDFPGYGTVAGAAHQGQAACPPCGMQLRGRYSNVLKKYVYPSARRWLPPNHMYRDAHFDPHFGGQSETRLPPITVSPREQREALVDYQAWLTSIGERRSTSGLHGTRIPGLGRQRQDRLDDPSKQHGIKRDSIFNSLPYWEHLDIRFTLDVMHVERNFAENLLLTICGIKPKDDSVVREDMEEQGVRPDLWMTIHPNLENRKLKPKANYVLTKEEFHTFCSRLEQVKVPSKYCSDIGKHVREKKISSLKSHDYHILIQYLLPLGLRGLMSDTTRVAILRCCRLFRRLCCRTWNPALSDSLRVDVAETMTLMELTFPPSFFVMMSHLPLHLVEELIILGPVHVRWMYPVERTLGALKNYVWNRSRPEASIALGYLLEETMGFMTSYMDGFEEVRRRVWDSNPEDCDDYEVMEGAANKAHLSTKLRDVAHLYVLRNNTLMLPYYRRWAQENDRTGGSCGNATTWIYNAVKDEELDVTDPNEGDILFLSSPPSQNCLRYERMMAYSNHWRVDDARSQNFINYDCGVAVVEPYDSEGNRGEEYVGVLKHILELDYGLLNSPLRLFMVQWKKRLDNAGRPTYIRDSDGFLHVNFKFNLPKSQDPFIFPEQCTQVYFNADDDHNGEWKVVIRKDPRTRHYVEEEESVSVPEVNVIGECVAQANYESDESTQNLAGTIRIKDSENVIDPSVFWNLMNEKQSMKKKDSFQQPRKQIRREPLKKRA